jgi:hypothetical protein
VFAALAIVDEAALGRDIDGALLLVLSALLKVPISENLEIDESEADDGEPEQKSAAQEVEAVVRGGARRGQVRPSEIILVTLQLCPHSTTLSS